VALLAATSVTSTATTVTATAIGSAPFTVAASDIGTNGALLNIINGGGGSINVTLEDPGFTGLGNGPSEPAQAVGAGADRWFRLSPGHADSTGVATVTLSGTTSVTYKLIRC
jgi:hypothetical protein